MGEAARLGSGIGPGSGRLSRRSFGDENAASSRPLMSVIVDSRSPIAYQSSTTSSTVSGPRTSS